MNRRAGASCQSLMWPVGDCAIIISEKYGPPCMAHSIIALATLTKILRFARHRLLGAVKQSERNVSIDNIARIAERLQIEPWRLLKDDYLTGA
jgi:hypothetical protein